MRTYSLHTRRTQFLGLPNRSSYTVWKGLSPHTGEQIQLVLTGFKNQSTNGKTGPMIQAWIMPVHTSPASAMTSGKDDSVCGGCIQRPSVGGKCYVGSRAPSSVFRGYAPTITLQEASILLGGLAVRAGAWGDPAMIPLAVWNILLSHVSGWTGYTHQWREPWFDPQFKSIFMYSVDSKAQALEALKLGARYFRAGVEKLSWERLCLAESKHKLTCKQCGLCDGDRGISKMGALASTSIFIPLHGYLSSRPAQGAQGVMNASLRRLESYLLAG